ncbi:OTU-like cysteine protease [Teladorsagia circumcincta]|uniref:ubiquitinyl hydrolase 1 n=1 Tax=Teladorsagia circumcincta TaxID=45464 RepID=A0A2G9UL54_TELCI|nr:OTU-like cysteine protease [Teladorsagia circumcincta]
MAILHKSNSRDGSDCENQRPIECDPSGEGGSYARRRCGNRRRDARSEFSRRGSVSPGANSGDEYDVRFSRNDEERNRDHFAPFVAENFSSYVARKRQPGQHGNHVELQAISEMFARPIEIYEYSEMVDPFAPTAGIGLGLPDLYPRGANNLRDAVKESEDRSVEQALLESQLALTDIERTEREINEQIARDSYMEYLRMLVNSGNPAPGSITKYGPCPATAEEEDEALACALSLSKQQYLEELQYRYGTGSEDCNNN